MSRCSSFELYKNMMVELHWDSIEQRSLIAKFMLFFKMVNNLLPTHFCNLISMRSTLSGHSTRFSDASRLKVNTIRCRSFLYANTFFQTCANVGTLFRILLLLVEVYPRLRLNLKAS